MNADPKLQIEIIGHNNALEIKAGEENKVYADMDRKRVELAVEYFTENGIDESRLKPSYKEDTTPSIEIEEDDDPEVKDAKNRRIEFKVSL